MENELEKALCAEIAARSPFTAQQVYSAWEICKSFDNLVKAVDLCAVLGLKEIVIPGSRPTAVAVNGACANCGEVKTRIKPAEIVCAWCGTPRQ